MSNSLYALLLIIGSFSLWTLMSRWQCTFFFFCWQQNGLVVCVPHTLGRRQAKLCFSIQVFFSVYSVCRLFAKKPEQVVSAIQINFTFYWTDTTVCLFRLWIWQQLRTTGTGVLTRKCFLSLLSRTGASSGVQDCSCTKAKCVCLDFLMIVNGYCRRDRYEWINEATLTNATALLVLLVSELLALLSLEKGRNPKACLSTTIHAAL